MGFVSRQRTEFLLKNKPSGTFLIRFSESNKDGAITFSWVDHSRGEARVHAVQPYTKKELLALSFPDVINTYTLTAFGKNSNPLLYLYPDIPKDAAFGQYYKVPASPTGNNKNKEYVPRRMVVMSEDPTPPPSPPSEPPMDLELDLEINEDWCKMLGEFFDCFDESEIMWQAYEETSHIHLAPETDYADPGHLSQ